MTVKSRIVTSSIGVEYLDLTEAEHPHYHGAGNAVVYFNDDAIITGIDYIHDAPEDGATALADKALRHGNAWLGMCSSYTVCDLRKLDASWPVGIARIMRLVAKNYDLENMYDDDYI
tara:strand:- start:449 stop:799 length:351 start_codon:yes stop_codon:yes gene_type:complete